MLGAYATAQFYPGQVGSDPATTPVVPVSMWTKEPNPAQTGWSKPSIDDTTWTKQS